MLHPIVPTELLARILEELAHEQPWPRLEALILHLERIVDPTFNSDGISFVRIVESNPAGARLAGKVWHIRQTRHTFWLELAQLPGSVAWSFYFDVVPGGRSPRRVDLVAEAIDDVEQAEWRVHATGSVCERADGGLAVAPSTE